ncbi:uncharacterized protein LOC126772869 [Nymphalis io]|uniref:uncharacterized protein LOC126772869 n=1 Tax=Inachis io TaxID=171585 RepID=UPI00216A1995|nr:uncharacterized protein LOC126772869 [Nymphalis io]
MFVQNIFIFYLMFLTVVFGSVDDDYYYISALRSSSLICKNFVQQMYCQIKCGMEAAICIHENCYCLSLTLAGAKDVAHQHQIDEIRQDEREHENVNFIESDELHMIQKASPETSDSFYAKRPTVRHHIAHFCPNLDVARECIKKCMVVGKPAFCGKDHVCYCGHSYSNNDDDTAADAKETYAQFKDLYTKYFGTDRDTIEMDL